MNATQRFSYTAQRRGYLVTLAVFMFSMFVETGLLTLVVIVAVHVTLLKTLILLASTGLFLFLVFTLLRPLWTKHRLTATDLEVYYGSLRLVIPRTAILTAKPVRERLSIFQPMKAQVDTKRRQLTAAFSEQGQVLITLDKAFPVRIGRTTSRVTRVLINVDTVEVLLAALDREKQVLPVSTASLTSTNSTIVSSSSVEDTLRFDNRPDERSANISAIASDAEVAIRVEKLTRRFKAYVAVDALDMTIRRGEIYGFLGSNGAGKTTTIKMLVGLLQPDGGRAWIAGHDVWREPFAAKAVLGYVADRSVLYERLTGREFLNFLAQMRGLPRVESAQRINTLLEQLALSEHADRSCAGYSFGMKRKLSLASALLHQPQVLMLDEPLNGLDPRSARHLKDLLVTLSQQGTTILLSTHDLSVAESLCHRVGILHRGRLLAEGSASALREMAAASNLEDVFLSLTEEHTAEQEVVKR